METLFKVIDLEKEERIGILNVEAHSKVKSTKSFPMFMIDGKKMIFKPLSKTKPLTTPLFAYSEVYWSYIINKYFDSRTPRYFLATFEGIEKEQSKYYEQGVLVESITPDDEKLINLYDYFNEYPEISVDIKDYTNYCMINYDYTEILQSEFIKNNKDIGEGLAFQILLSMLRQDQNFHYENVNFVCVEGKLMLAPPIDFEFSTPFLYPDKEDIYQFEKQKYMDAINIKYEEDTLSKFLKQLRVEHGMRLTNILTGNICSIVKMYPDTVLNFVKILDKLEEDLPKITITDEDNYIGLLNSDYWEVGHAYYKENDLEKYNELQEKIELKEIDKAFTFRRISTDILEFNRDFNKVLKTYLIAYYNGIEDLENLTMKELFSKLDVPDDAVIEDIDIYNKQIKLKKGSIK